MNTKKSSERGQALILIVLIMTALIAIAGLAVDGGSTLAHRRQAQNTADAAALAGALAKINAHESELPIGSVTATNSILGNMCSAALERAASNNFVDTSCTTTASDPDVNVEVYSPPISGLYSDCANAVFNCSDYVQVVITTTSRTYMARLLGIQTITSRVEAVSLGKGPETGPIFGGNAIVALNPSSSACNGDMIIGGSGILNVVGGGMWVNSDNPDCAFVQDGCKVIINAEDGGINSVGGINLNENCEGNYVGTTTTGVEPFPYPPEYIPDEPPECSVAGTYTINNATQTTTLTPGWYDTLPPNVSGTIIMQPGNYCVNKVLKFTSPNNTLTGNGVFIYIRNGGTFSLQGGAVQLTAPTSGDYQGYLIYVADNFTGTVPNCTINGGSNDIFVGAIYAPYCNITINGSADFNGLQAQIIGYTVKLLGDTLLNVIYNPDQNPEGYRPPRIGLMR